MLHKYLFPIHSPSTWHFSLSHCGFPVWLDWRPCPELPLLGRRPRTSVSRWVNVEADLEPGKRPRGFGARRFRPELPLLGRCISRWVNVEPNLEPGKCPHGFGGARSFPCWVEVLEQVSPAGWTWNSEPGKCPRGCGAQRPTRSFPCWVEVLKQCLPLDQHGI